MFFATRRPGPTRALRLGLVVSKGPLTASISRGVELGIAEAEVLGELFGLRVELLKRSAASPAETLAAGRRLIREERAVALVGGTDDPAAEALGAAAKQGAGLFLNVGAASNRLREDLCEGHTYHIQASVSMRVEAAGLWLVEERRRSRWALLTSGSAFGREVEEAASRLLERLGGAVLARERPPDGRAGWDAVLRRLREARPEALFLGLETHELRDFIPRYRQADLPSDLSGVAPDPRVVAGADAPLAGVWPLLWHHSLERYSARELNGRFRRRFREGLDDASWAAWAAVKLLSEAAVRSEATDAGGLIDYLGKGVSFDGHKGDALSFRARDRQLLQPMYLVGRRDGPKEAGAESGPELVLELSRERLEAAGGEGGPCQSQG